VNIFNKHANYELEKLKELQSIGIMTCADEEVTHINYVTIMY